MKKDLKLKLQTYLFLFIIVSVVSLILGVSAAMGQGMFKLEGVYRLKEVTYKNDYRQKPISRMEIEYIGSSAHQVRWGEFTTDKIYYEDSYTGYAADDREFSISINRPQYKTQDYDNEIEVMVSKHYDGDPRESLRMCFIAILTKK